MKKLVAVVLSVLLLSPVSFARPKVALVLSGGAAKGLAEIPLLQALEEEGIPIDLVVGTSFGAILGAMYSVGYSPREIRDELENLDYLAILNEKSIEDEKLPPHSFDARSDNFLSVGVSQNGIGTTPGVLGDEKILLMLSNYFSQVQTVTNFDDLDIPFRAISTDATTGERLVLGSGSLTAAVRASMSIPVVWNPAPVDGTYTFDGGVTDNLPIQVAKDLGADVVIAVDVLSDKTIPTEKLDTLNNAMFQFIDMVMTTTAASQYHLADLVLKPELKAYTLADFWLAKDIIKAGEKCVEDNREAIHNIALALEKQGVELNKLPYSRKGKYGQRPLYTIEKITVTDVSLMPSVALPVPGEFKQFVGLTLDDKTKQLLAERLTEVQKFYHLTSLNYHVRQGSAEDKCVLELQANHYHRNLSKIFMGGDLELMIGKPESSNQTQFLPVPEFAVGVHLVSPLELVGKVVLANTSTVNVNILPPLFITDRGTALKLDGGLGAKHGSLTPGSNRLNKDRVIAEDNAFTANVGASLTFIDLLNVSAGARYEADYIRSTKTSYQLMDLYFEAAFDSLQNPFTSLKGIKLEATADYMFDLKGNASSASSLPLFAAHAMVCHHIELWKHKLALGYQAAAMVNRLPYQLNAGFAEYGGVYGMSGVPYGAMKRDFAFAGLSLQYVITEIAAMPLVATLQGKVGLKDGCNAFDAGNVPGSVFFDKASMDIGVGGYIGLKTPLGSLVMGGSYNLAGQWCISVGFN